MLDRLFLFDPRRSLWPRRKRGPHELWQAADAASDLSRLTFASFHQHDVGVPCASATPCGIAPCTKPRHSTAPLGFPGSAITRERSMIAARLRDKIEFGVIFIDSARITSPKPGNSTRIIARIASGVTSRGPAPVPPVVKIKPQPCCEKERIVS